MSAYHEIIEADKVYLEEVGMRDILQQFVADAMESHPVNVYEYMITWATKRQASSIPSPKGVAHRGDEEKCPIGGEEEEEGAAAKTQAEEEPGARDHEQHHFSSNKSSPSGAHSLNRASSVNSKAFSPVAAAKSERTEGEEGM
ncbi:hypothetical protein LPMP_261720 [Leishmania panamensis]|uniref:Uncharacterized protein n=2 Tax=Leishmania guyanensis species complex TaxID=38579 RepID=A0A088RVJ7_LEIPA|nr:hypothetical protein LPMP_261720 [Leishmania panamensis]AIN99284.1 hypothetical protein LPMP_261720 [Leishmania panamensis]